MNASKLMRYLAALLALSAIMAQAQAFKSQYMVIDISGGPDAEKYPVSYETKPPDLDFDTCRTKELWLRLAPAGSFLMGSPANELGRRDSEVQHRVTLTQPFYIGVFEVTQKQYELIMGINPAKLKGDSRPVESVSYEMLRGSSEGAGWPANSNVDDTSFFGKLRAKTGMLADLPTEAQWEYACRAGTTTALNSKRDLTQASGYCPNVAKVARYAHNRQDGKGGETDHTKVGMYLPNAWGLYDMHGNVNEWCRDWHDAYLGKSVKDPVGAVFGERRVLRGGGFLQRGNSNENRSAYRDAIYLSPHGRADGTGFRIVVLPDPGQVKPVLSEASPQETLTLGETEEKLAATCAEFKAVWDVYKTNAEKINAEFQPKTDAVLQQYRKSLETLRDTVQRRGDLEKTQAVVTEMERFEEAKSLPSAPDEATIAEIKSLQANAIRPFAALEKDRLSRITTLTRRYGQALEQLQPELVRAGKLADATAVKEARERAKRAE